MNKRSFEKSRIRVYFAPTAFGICFAAICALADDPRTNSWLTTYSCQYARIYTNAAMQAAGTAITTWSNGAQSRTYPAYCGVQEVYSPSDWVYICTTGLASYTMGPWYFDAQHTQTFFFRDFLCQFLGPTLFL